MPQLDQNHFRKERGPRARVVLILDDTRWSALTLLHATPLEGGRFSFHWWFLRYSQRKERGIPTFPHRGPCLMSLRQVEWLERPSQLQRLAPEGWQRLSLPVGLEAELKRRLRTSLARRVLVPLVRWMPQVSSKSTTNHDNLRGFLCSVLAIIRASTIPSFHPPDVRFHVRRVLWDFRGYARNRAYIWVAQPDIRFLSV